VNALLDEMSVASRVVVEAAKSGTRVRLAAYTDHRCVPHSPCRAVKSWRYEVSLVISVCSPGAPLSIGVSRLFLVWPA